MDFENLDIDKLIQALTAVRDLGVLEADLRALRFKFPPPAPTVETVVKPSIDSPKTDAPNGYAQLLGKLPAWPKAS